jgi:hypothetical protein
MLLLDCTKEKEEEDYNGKERQMKEEIAVNKM